MRRDIKTPFEQEEDYYGPKRVNNFWISLHEYLNKIKLYLRNKTTDLQNSDAWKIQLTIAINFISSKDAKEERVVLVI